MSLPLTLPNSPRSLSAGSARLFNPPRDPGDSPLPWAAIPSGPGAGALPPETHPPSLPPPGRELQRARRSPLSLLFSRLNGCGADRPGDAGVAGEGPGAGQWNRPPGLNPAAVPQERQNIIRYWLENLRAKQGESLHNIHFLEGQPISEYSMAWPVSPVPACPRRCAVGTPNPPVTLSLPHTPPCQGHLGTPKCLNGGCGVPEEEEEEEERRESDSEEESALDCGLKLKKVSFIEKAERRGGEPSGPEDESFLEEGSPTMVEKGMDPASVFELCEDEEEAEGAPGSPVKAVEPVVVPRAGRRRRTAESREEEEGEEEGRRRNRASWIDPPEEDYSTQLTQAEVESCMKKYEDTFQDYQEMFIQFGYVVLFSSAFPLAAMCALVNNVIEIRSDAFKLCTGLQRPFGQRVESIGQWQKVMEAMGVLAIVVNCYLIAQCGQLQRLFPWLSPEGAIISVVVLEHFALFLKYIIQVAIPDIPAWVAEEMAKLEYQRREAFKKHERQAQHHFQQQQRRKREEEERQRHAEYQARKERESSRDEAKPEAAGQDPAHEKSQSKGKGSGGSSHGSDKPKRPSSLLATNNVMKLKQIIPLQGKFLSGGAGASSTATARSPQSPTGSENKLPGFLSFKFLKSPETKRDAGTEKVQSPTKPFNPGKLFNFGNSAVPRSAGPGPAPHGISLGTRVSRSPSRVRKEQRTRERFLGRRQGNKREHWAGRCWETGATRAPRQPSATGTAVAVPRSGSSGKLKQWQEKRPWGDWGTQNTQPCQGSCWRHPPL
uniref:Anoctamin n=1 Tax=Athene cunicularia TaxID=194338 RepID=A0A663N819_ATHCN